MATGTAVELTAKAYCVSIDPALLADKGDRDSLLLLGDNSRLTTRRPTEARTIPAYTALDAARLLLHPTVLPWVQAQDRTVLEVRNAAAHMGLVDAVELKHAVTQMCRLLQVLVPALELDLEVYYESAWPVVQGLLDEAKSDTARVVAAKVAAAQRWLDALLHPFDDASRVVVLAALSGRAMSSSDHEEPQGCPVCSQRGGSSVPLNEGTSSFPTTMTGRRYRSLSVLPIRSSSSAPCAGLSSKATSLASSPSRTPSSSSLMTTQRSCTTMNPTRTSFVVADVRARLPRPPAKRLRQRHEEQVDGYDASSRAPFETCGQNSTNDLGQA